jgi:hypothetical protein
MSATPKTWLFQANPASYDVRRAIVELPSVTWLVKRYANEISVGDRVYLWESGRDGGIVGVGEIVEPARTRPELEEERQFSKDPSKFAGNKPRCVVHISEVIDPILPRKRIQGDGRLKDLSILKMPQGTNFSVTPSQTSAIEDLLQSDNRPFVWWVNQGTNYDVEHREGYVWAGKLAKDGRPLDHHNRVIELQPGECVFHYANGAMRAVGEVLESPKEAPRPNQVSVDEQKPGYYASIRYSDLSKPLELGDIPLEWRTNNPGPFDRDGTVKQGYLYKVSKGFAGGLARLVLEGTPALKAVQPLAQLAEPSPTDSARWWVEKTFVKGEPTRETGEYAFGKVL